MKKNKFFQEVIKIIGFSEGATKKEIAKKLDLTTAGITKVIKEMEELKLIKEFEYAQSTGGRKPIIYIVNEEKVGNILGINLAPQKIEFVVSDIYGKNLRKKIIKFENKKNNEILEFIILEVENEIKKNKNISIISIVVNGLVDSENGISIFSPHYKWKNINLKKIFEDKFSLPTVVENDVRAMALTEKIFGSCKNIKDFVVLNISEGVGTGIYIGDQLYSGNKFIAGEIGHITVDRESKRKCSCGKFGCLEAEASNLAIIEKVSEIFKKNSKEKVLEKINTKFIMLQMQQKNSDVIKIVDDITKKIAIGIDIIISVINPEKIILVGDFLKEKVIYKKLLESVAEFVLPEQKCEIEMSEYKDEIGIYSTIALVNYKLYTDEKILKKVIKRR